MGWKFPVGLAFLFHFRVFNHFCMNLNENNKIIKFHRLSSHNLKLEYLREEYLKFGKKKLVYMYMYREIHSNELHRVVFEKWSMIQV